MHDVALPWEMVARVLRCCTVYMMLCWQSWGVCTHAPVPCMLVSVAMHVGWCCGVVCCSLRASPAAHQEEPFSDETLHVRVQRWRGHLSPAQLAEILDLPKRELGLRLLLRESWGGIGRVRGWVETGILVYKASVPVGLP